ncbi:sigma-70 family RNA polymerase sigma factor [Streptomyces sp. NPDC102462]|uniref:sigma-70 family RNA polymerase sigma factor n=1 Tax=Streptomyces sp. NPDC102462 TaxID=3366178 RepID=UPI00380BFB60
MSDRTPHPPDDQQSAEAGDAELIALTRAGDSAAYEVLYSRHRQAAVACARYYAPREADVDDLVAEGFANVLDTIRKGSGPTEFFRGYLMQAIRHSAFRTTRQQRRTVLTDMWESSALVEPVRDPATEAFDSEAVSQAFRSLPERWQAVLWHTEVEGETPAAVAPVLGLRPNSVSALAYRAREGLRMAYIQAHITTASDQACRKHTAKLGAYTRGRLSTMETGLVREHLENCERCKGLYLELADVSASMRAVVAPLILGPAASALLLHAQGSAVPQGAGHPPRARVRLRGKGTSGKPLAGSAAAAVVVGAGALALALTGIHRAADDDPYNTQAGRPPSPAAGPSSSASSSALPLDPVSDTDSTTGWPPADLVPNASAASVPADGTPEGAPASRGPLPTPFEWNPVLVPVSLASMSASASAPPGAEPSGTPTMSGTPTTPETPRPSEFPHPSETPHPSESPTPTASATTTPVDTPTVSEAPSPSGSPEPPASPTAPASPTPGTSTEPEDPASGTPDVPDDPTAGPSPTPSEPAPGGPPGHCHWYDCHGYACHCLPCHPHSHRVDRADTLVPGASDGVPSALSAILSVLGRYGFRFPD